MTSRARSVVAVTGFTALLVFLFSSVAPAQRAGGLTPQGGTVVSVTPTTGGGVTVGGTAAKPTVGLLQSCSSTQVLAWNGAAWACATSGGGGDITDVVAGSGLTGGGTTGAVTLDVGCGTNLLCNANDVSLNLTGASCSAGNFVSALSAVGGGTCTAEVGDISGVTVGTGMTGGGTTGAISVGLNLTGASCSAGQHVSAIGSTGTGTCTADAGDITDVNAFAPLSGGSTFSGAANIGLTLCGANQILKTNAGVTAWACVADATGITNSAGNNVVMKSDGTNAVASAVTDNGTTWALNTNKVTMTEASGNTAIAGTLDAVGAITENAVRVLSAVGPGLSKTAATVNLNLAGASCSAGQFMTALGSTGTGTCSSTAISGTNNTVAKFTGTNTIGNSLLTDDGTNLKYNTTAMNLNSSGSVNFGAAIVAGTTVAAGQYLQAGNSVYGGGSSATVYLSSGVGGIGIVPGLNCLYSTAATADCYINAVGAAEGTTQFRNLRIQDGKNADIATFTGSTHGVSFVGDVTVNGATTLGDSTGDAIGFTGTVGSHVQFKNRTNTISCGSGATQITGSGDERGGIAFSTSTTTCQITFANAAATWANAPFCTANLNTVAAVAVSAVSTSSVTFTFAAKGAGDKLYYHCDGGN